MGKCRDLPRSAARRHAGAVLGWHHRGRAAWQQRRFETRPVGVADASVLAGYGPGAIAGPKPSASARPLPYGAVASQYRGFGLVLNREK